MTYSTLKLSQETLANTTTASDQFDSAIARLAAGGYVISWTSNDPRADGNGSGIRAQLFTATGAKSGAEFVVNSAVALDQTQSAITGLAGGGFVATWKTDDTKADGSSSAVKGQLFNATGAKVGGEFLVNTAALNDQQTPTITGLANGGFVASWRDGATALKAQMYSATGAKMGSELKVADGGSYFPSISALASGGFAVTWSSRNTATLGDPLSFGVLGQIYTATGVKQGATFLVNTETTGTQISSVITALPHGGFVVSWTDGSGVGADQSGTGIKAQLFDANGAKVGAEFLVNTQTAGDQSESSITTLDDGTFLVSWTTTDPLQDGSDLAVKGQIFSEFGARLGGEFLINTITTNYQGAADVKGLAGGGFAASWTDFSGVGGDASGTAIKTQVFSIANTNIASADNDLLTGTTNADTINGLAGDDQISGGAGNDTLIGGAGNDVLIGGTGIDTASYVEALKAVTVDLAITKIQDTRGDGKDILFSIENLTGSSFNDKLSGDVGDNVLDGRTGADRLVGRDGNDTLIGGAGRDTLDGGNGDDRLIGGADADKLTGGAGADTFVFDTLTTTAAKDVVTDFVSGTDHIELSAAAFTALSTFGPGVLADSHLVLGAAAVTADDHLIYNAATGALFYDADGAGGAAQVQIAAFTNLVPLQASDFIIA